MRRRRRHGLVDGVAVAGVEGEGEEREVGGAVLALAEARADDDGGDGGLLQHPAGRDIGDGDAMPLCHGIEGGEHALQGVPAADLLDEAAVLHLAPVGDVGGGGLGLAEPFLVEQPAGQRAVGEELHAVLEADGAHLLRRAPVEHGEADLVRNDRDAELFEQQQVVGVEIGDAERADPAFVAERGELAHGVDVARVLEHPPMELQEIDAVGAQAVEAALDAGAHRRAVHRARLGAPFGEGGGLLAGQALAAPDASISLKRPVMSSALP